MGEGLTFKLFFKFKPGYFSLSPDVNLEVKALVLILRDKYKNNSGLNPPIRTVAPFFPQLVTAF